MQNQNSKTKKESGKSGKVNNPEGHNQYTKGQEKGGAKAPARNSGGSSSAKKA